jgi:hypothetical protein
VIKLTPFSINFRKGMHYSLRTSPIVAMSVAVNLGATKLILFGVQFTNHKTYNAGEKKGDHEVRQYLKFFDALRKIGAEVYLGANGTAFDKYLPIWKQN